MREAHLARMRARTAADDGAGRSAVMRRAERPASVVTRVETATAHGCDRGHVERLSGASGGSNPGRRCASMLLPVPGGPTSTMLCPPAAATISARLAAACPRTSARSGVFPLYTTGRQTGAAASLRRRTSRRSLRRRLTRLSRHARPRARRASPRRDSPRERRRGATRAAHARPRAARLSRASARLPGRVLRRTPCPPATLHRSESATEASRIPSAIGRS